MAFLQLPRLICRKALGTQGHSLIDPHTFADDRGFSYHNTRAVIDKETTANLRAGVDINAGGRVCNLCADARQQRQPCTVQMMGQPVMNHRQNPRIAQQHLIHTARRRVTVISRQDVCVEDAAQAG